MVGGGGGGVKFQIKHTILNCTHFQVGVNIEAAPSIKPQQAEPSAEEASTEEEAVDLAGEEEEEEEQEKEEEEQETEEEREQPAPEEAMEGEGEGEEEAKPEEQEQGMLLACYSSTQGSPAFQGCPLQQSSLSLLQFQLQFRI